MKIILSLLGMTILNAVVMAQDDPLSPVQLEKGYICGIEAGYNIREFLYEGSHVTVERLMGEEEYFLKYNNYSYCFITCSIYFLT